MELSPTTKVSELLSKYSFLKDFLIGMDPQFKLLNNPFMMKTLGRIATMNKVAFMTGMKLDRLLPAVAGEIGKRTGETPVVRLETPAGPDDGAQKMEALKGIIRDLHRGVDKHILTERFQELIKDVAPWEIANMEQQLMAEGLHQDEIKRLCDVHVEVFRSALEKKVVPGLPAGHPVHTYMLENRAAEDILKEIETADIEKDRERLSRLLHRLSDINAHYTRKENQLFPILESKGLTGPSKVMWALHDDIRAMLKDVRAKAETGTVKAIEVKALLHIIADMIYKEEHIFYPMALESLTEEDWGRVREGEEDIGYAWVTPEEEWRPSPAEFGQEPLTDRTGSLNLDTGLLTVEQINLVLTHLPVDISFVNDKDEVVYYSQTAERIFPRSPGIIGRKVQNCHPPKSVDLVEKILVSFKDGTKSSAEFWIQMKGRFVHIRYFAVRDAEGTYKGTLEVSQDVTDIRSLNGQKRLLNWD
ncbi:MAG: DUF438 domain-containing protein [Nitrospirae bacterium]|nr:MAG: DUF438 domain-containing protein [Nitrospirota bacterium]